MTTTAEAMPTDAEMIAWCDGYLEEVDPHATDDTRIVQSIRNRLAAKAQVVPDGSQVVPKEPTPDMLHRCSSAMKKQKRIEGVKFLPHMKDYEKHKLRWGEMLSAAPVAPLKTEAEVRKAALEEAITAIDQSICDVAENTELFMQLRNYFAHRVRSMIEKGA